MKTRPTTLPGVVKIERERKMERMKRRFEDPVFKRQIMSIRMSVGAGMSLAEARNNAGIESDSLWDDLVFALSVSLLSPEHIVLEWQIRNSTRYAQAMSLYVEAEKEKDFDMMSRAIMMLQKIDETDIEMKRAFGLIKPIQDEETGGYGVSQEDLDRARQQFDSAVEQRILHKLEVKRGAKPPVPLDVLIGLATERQPDVLGQTTVAEDSSGGQQSGDSIPKIVSDGG